MPRIVSRNEWRAERKKLPAQHHPARFVFAWLTLGLLAGALATPALADVTAVDGHEIYYETHGGPVAGRTPVLLLHGGMNTIEMNFSDLIPRLAANHSVIAVEQQGHGYTADRDAPVTLATMRRDTLGFLDDLGVDQVHVVGFSMGGMLGLELAVNAPVLIAIGDRDFILPGHAVHRAETIPNARLANLPDTTHMTITKQTKLILPMVEGLIASAEREPAAKE